MLQGPSGCPELEKDFSFGPQQTVGLRSASTWEQIQPLRWVRASLGKQNSGDLQLPDGVMALGTRRPSRWGPDWGYTSADFGETKMVLWLLFMSLLNKHVGNNLTRQLDVVQWNKNTEFKSMSWFWIPYLLVVVLCDIYHIYQILAKFSGEYILSIFYKKVYNE